jgi:ribonuclease-3
VAAPTTSSQTYSPWGNIAVDNRHRNYRGTEASTIWNMHRYAYHQYNSTASNAYQTAISLQGSIAADMTGETPFPLCLSEFNVHTAANFDTMPDTLDYPAKYARFGAIVCEHLYRRFPEELEGELTKIKSNAVSRRVCAELAVELGLADAVQLGKGMGGRTQLPQSLLAALFESVIGAMYLDGGIEPARMLVLRLLDRCIDESARFGHQQNFKSVLQQSLQRKDLGSPAYIVLDETGPDHAKCFEICVALGERRFTGCWGMSKKAAEQGAALHALRELGFVVDGPTGPQVQLPQAIADTMP